MDIIDQSTKLLHTKLADSKAFDDFIMYILN